MNLILENGSSVNTGYGELVIEKSIGKGKSGYSYLAQKNNEEVVLKIMHDEPVPYYNFTKNKVDLEVNAYELLSNIKVKVPELYYSNSKEKYLVKEYLEGNTGAEWIIKDGEDEKIIEQLFAMAKIAKKHNLNIDFFPSNFVITQGELYYIDYEVNNYDPAWDLLNWGIFYWANREGFTRFMKDGDASAINIDIAKGQPIREPFREKVEYWISQFL